ncbi:MAG: ribonuclease D [Hyphomicrobiaceae bacterium]|nr:ribonuclease D [Hyphomicrobiaceae bacterium]
MITKTNELEQVCSELSKTDFVCVDTEFMRESTFWPELCLIQMAGGDVEVIIDPLAANLDLESFFKLMRDQQVTKVFHAARQDIEIIQYLSNSLPAPVFDTQIAAMVCGFGEQVGYADLIQKLLNTPIDKTSRYSDWRRRPLHEHQLTYALADVTYLARAYPKLVEQINKAGRSSWLTEEMTALVNPDLYIQHPDNAWKRLKLRNIKKNRLGILIELAKWREATAQSRNLPRNRVVKDDVLYEVANQAPANESELGNLRSITKGIVRSSYGAELLKGVQRGLAIDLDLLPVIKRPPRLNSQTQAIVELLKVLLKTTAAKHNVASKIIANAKDIEKIALDDEADVAALKGWRRDLFGADALALKNGKISLGLRDGAICAIEINKTAHPEEG